MTSTIISAAVALLIVTVILVVLLLVVKDAITPKGKVKIDINEGKKVIDVTPGNSLMASLASEKIFLPSACGGKANCGQCKVQVLEGGGEILPTEVGFFNRKQIKEGWRLGCQVKVKENLKIQMDESALSVKKLECEVISNHNVATFIKEFTVKLPEGEHIEFKSGQYIQIDIPAYHLYFKDIEVEPEYRADWEKYGFFNLESVNPEATIRAYSMASYPGEKGIIKLNVRIATPPFKPKDQGPGFMDVNPGIASSYIFSLKPGDKVIMSGPYGEFRPQYGTGREMIWVGGGAGMAPLRAQIMHMLKGNGIAPEDRQREMHYFYGARALEEIPFLDDFLTLDKEFPNFHFHLALDRPDPKADEAGIAYTPGFVAPVMGDTYLKQHENPEDCEYYLCGPPMMAKTVLDLLHSLGVEDDMIRFDNFGG